MTPWRLRLYSRLLLIPLTFPFLVAVLAGRWRRNPYRNVLVEISRPSTTQGLLVNQGGAERLYDVDVLHEVHSSWAGQVDRNSARSSIRRSWLEPSRRWPTFPIERHTSPTP